MSDLRQFIYILQMKLDSLGNYGYNNHLKVIKGI